MSQVPARMGEHQVVAPGAAPPAPAPAAPPPPPAERRARNMLPRGSSRELPATIVANWGTMPETVGSLAVPPRRRRRAIGPAVIPGPSGTMPSGGPPANPNGGVKKNKKKKKKSKAEKAEMAKKAEEEDKKEVKEEVAE
ncbi:hypothetical protein MGU_06801 [Metarhizium guizhouense ARSEF 977]|uniref:Uncharacterized protein n=1 Tax=Metarhizium guizhouense (strain ARSEF 977) TaxID=1276136 RepID=A0A0B4I1D5_METGA|nr:hypothetical protein MGU_06801 [Metarhizium guizhouense ARSEF 977]